MTKALTQKASSIVAFLAHRISRGDALIVGFVALFVPLFFTNIYALAPKMFSAVFVPAALLIWFGLDWTVRWPALKVSLVFKSVFVFSATISALFVYLLSMDLSSWSQPFPNRGLLDQQWAFSGQILFFALATAYAVAFYENFLPRLIAILTPLVAISALVNMWKFFGDAPSGARLADMRLINWLGMPGYTNATNISVTYAVFFVATLAAAFDRRAGRWTKFWLAPFALILLVGIVFTQARSAYIGTTVGAVCVIITGGGFAFLRANAVKSALAIAILGALIVSIPSTRSVIGDRGESFRPEIWRVYAGKAVEKPLLGYGGLSNIDVKIPNGMTIDQPHNIILSAQIRGGIFCMLAMVVMLASSAWWSFQYFAARRGAIPLVLIATLASTSMFDYNLLITAPTWPWITFWFPFAICAGAEIATRIARRGTDAVVDGKMPESAEVR